MKITRYLNFSFTIVCSVLLISCGGEDGEIGPQGIQGEQGPQGEQGSQGASGEQGAPGEDGNANVQSFLFEQQNLEELFNSFSIPAITQEILDFGVVIGYCRPIGNSEWYPIPTPPEFDGYVDLYSINLGEVITRSSDFNYRLDVRFIIIQGNDGWGAKSIEIRGDLKNAGIDVSDFSQVANYYGLDY